MKCSVLLLLTLLAGAGSYARSENAEITQRQLVGAMRFLNTEEVSYRSKKNRFASGDELLKWLQETGQINSAPAILSGNNLKPFELQISTSSDGNHYQIEIQRPPETSDQTTWCKPAAFSDDRGVIFLGLALGCDAPDKPSTE